LNGGRASGTSSAGSSRSETSVNSSLLHSENPDTNLPTSLQPTQYVPPSPTKKLRQTLGKSCNWVLDFVPVSVKRPINNAWEALKEKVMSSYPKQLKFEESKISALKAWQYIIPSKHQKSNL